jgi:hypothetical protein
MTGADGSPIGYRAHVTAQAPGEERPVTVSAMAGSPLLDSSSERSDECCSSAHATNLILCVPSARAPAAEWQSQNTSLVGSGPCVSRSTRNPPGLHPPRLQVAGRIRGRVRIQPPGEQRNAQSAHLRLERGVISPPGGQFRPPEIG